MAALPNQRTPIATAATRVGAIAAGVGSRRCVGMLGISFAAVPLYRIFCARTGFAGTTQVARVAPAVKGKRALIVRFDTNVAPGLAWRFAPETPQVKVRTGQTATVFFKVTNLSDDGDTRRAPSTTCRPGRPAPISTRSPVSASASSISRAHQTVEMPVVFFLDPALEQDETMNGIDEITLSYTFYPAPAAAPLTAAGESGGAPRL